MTAVGPEKLEQLIKITNVMFNIFYRWFLIYSVSGIKLFFTKIWFSVCKIEVLSNSKKLCLSKQCSVMGLCLQADVCSSVLISNVLFRLADVREFTT